MTNQMKQNTSNIADALSKFQDEGIAAVKEGNNPYFKSTYATLEDVIAAANHGAKHGLAFTQCIHTEKDIVESNVVHTMYVITKVMHTSGEEITSKYIIIPKKNAMDDSQALGSAITYAKRYSLQAIYGLPSEDDDGNANTHNPKIIKKNNDKVKEFEKMMLDGVDKITKRKDLSAAEKAHEIYEFKNANKSEWFEVGKLDNGKINMLKDTIDKTVKQLGEANDQGTTTN